MCEQGLLSRHSIELQARPLSNQQGITRALRIKICILHYKLFTSAIQTASYKSKQRYKTHWKWIENYCIELETEDMVKRELYFITFLFIWTVCLCIFWLLISAVREQEKIRNTYFEPILTTLYFYIAGKAYMTSLTCILCTQSICNKAPKKIWKIRNRSDAKRKLQFFCLDPFSCQFLVYLNSLSFHDSGSY